MKKIIILIVMLCHSLSYAGDFRGSNWGDSKEQAMKTESYKLKSSDDHSLEYIGEANGGKAIILYDFFKNRLFCGAYISNIKTKNYNQYLIDYDTLNSKLKDMHGEPDVEQDIWVDGSYFKELSRFLGYAVLKDDLNKTTVWNLRTKKVIHNLKEGPSSTMPISHMLVYYDYEIAEEYNSIARHSLR